MRKITFFLLTALGLLAVSCRNSQRMADYQRMIDSIQHAEAAKALEQHMPHNDPMTQYFDTLGMSALPLQYDIDFVNRLPFFSPVPKDLYPVLGADQSQELEARSLPGMKGCRVLLVAECPDSLNRTLYLYTMSANYEPIDHLCIYERKSVTNKQGETAWQHTEYFVTNHYEITLLNVRHDEQKKRLAIAGQRRYTIGRNGFFEEQIVEIE